MRLNGMSTNLDLWWFYETLPITLVICFAVLSFICFGMAYSHSPISLHNRNEDIDEQRPEEDERTQEEKGIWFRLVGLWCKEACS